VTRYKIDESKQLFVWIKEHVLFDENLTLIEKIILSFSEQTQGCTLSNEKLAKICSTTADNIRYHILPNMKKKGLISVFWNGKPGDKNSVRTISKK